MFLMESDVLVSWNKQPHDAQTRVQTALPGYGYLPYSLL